MFKALIGSAGALGFMLVAIAIQSAHADDNTIGQLSCGAGQIPKFTGSNWTCAEDETGNGGATGFVLMDSDLAGSKQVGEVITLYTGERSSRRQRATVILEFLLGTPALAAGPLGFDFSGPVAFDTDDCSGEPWENVLSAFVAFPEFSGRVTPSPDGPDVRRLYVRSSNDFEEIMFKAFLFGDSQRLGPGSPPFCVDIGDFLIDAYPMELVDPDLHITYPPPYTLVRQ